MLGRLYPQYLLNTRLGGHQGCSWRHWRREKCLIPAGNCTVNPLRPLRNLMTTPRPLARRRCVWSITYKISTEITMIVVGRLRRSTTKKKTFFDTPDTEIKIHKHLILQSLLDEITWRTRQTGKDKNLLDFKERVRWCWLGSCGPEQGPGCWIFGFHNWWIIFGRLSNYQLFNKTLNYTVPHIRGKISGLLLKMTLQINNSVF